MSKYLDSNGLLYLWGKIKSYVAEHGGGGTADSVAWDNVTGKPDLALKSDLSAVYRYKGSVTNYASLPAEGNTTGDVWNVEATGMNYAWDGEQWDPLGETVRIEAITNAEIDAVTAGVSALGYLDKNGVAYLWGKIKAALSGKQDRLTPGDGVAIKDDVISVEIPARALTLAEYNALSEEEKNADIEYLITDDNDTAGDSGGSCQNIYSAEETVVGRWIDGKPLYRKVFDVTNAVGAYIAPIINLTELGTSLGGLISLCGAGSMADMRSPSNSTYINLFVNPDNYIYAENTYTGPEKKWVILEYTKTTDEAKGAG